MDAYLHITWGSGGGGGKCVRGKKAGRKAKILQDFSSALFLFCLSQQYIKNLMFFYLLSHTTPPTPHEGPVQQIKN